MPSRNRHREDSDRSRHHPERRSSDCHSSRSRRHDGKSRSRDRDSDSSRRHERDRDSDRRRKSRSPRDNNRSNDFSSSTKRPSDESKKPNAFSKRQDEPEASIPWGGIPKKEKSEEPVEKEKPNLQPSGKLLEDTNMVKGTVVKYVEPPEAKLPSHNWQLHPFRNIEGKDPESLPVMHIHRRSCFLIGRDRKVCQFPMDHPSCSKQHAALQFRSLTYIRDDGEKGRRTRPYLIDLESANGTFINEERIEPSRYYELKHGDEFKFGFSSRSFVILNATAAMNQLKDESDDDEVEIKEEMEDEKPTSSIKKEDETKGDKFEI